MSNSESKYRKRAPIPVGKCGAARTIELLADKWMLLIVREAFFGVFRYDDILNDLGIPRSVLTQRLKRLVELQVLERKPYQETGARMRNGYVLTEKGRDLGLTLLALMQWGDAHIEGHKPALDVYNKTNQKKLIVTLVEEDAPRVAPKDVAYSPKNKPAAD